MVQGIYYDQETRSFSAGKFKHTGKAITAGATALGTTVGAVTAKQLAKKKAKEMGLKPGTDKYKKFVRKQTLKGAGIGTGAGLATGVATNVARSGAVQDFAKDYELHSLAKKLYKKGTTSEKSMNAFDKLYQLDKDRFRMRLDRAVKESFTK